MSAFSILAFEVRVNLPLRSGSDFELYEIGMVLGSLSTSLMRLDNFFITLTSNQPMLAF